MSTVSELLDRLSGIAVVRERLSETVRRVEQLAELVFEHDSRLTRIETIMQAAQQRARQGPVAATAKRARLPRK